MNFAREDRPGIFRILVWILMSAAGTRYLMKINGDFGYLRYLAIMYVIAGCALVVTSFTHSARTSRGSFLLFLSGILIVLDIARGSRFLFHFISAGLHYIAVSTLASTGSGFRRPRMILEYTEEPEKEETQPGQTQDDLVSQGGDR